jgi:hypothetical protein
MQQPQHANAAQQQQVVGSHGPFDAVLKRRTDGNMQFGALQHAGKLACYTQKGDPYMVVLQETVSSRLRLHAL